MDKKQQMEQIVNDFLQHAQSISGDLKTNLNQVKEQLHSMSAEDIDMKSDHVFTSPASQHQHQDDPQSMLQSMYSEMERVARQEQDNQQLQEVIQQMRYYFNIEEKDGFFP
ncbi:hypothetical protein [Alkalihalobacterium chitinilyticum]|uniref:DUF1657 domain-containing protein n=1 Tax=Alkalihalobacterium chitinilyticum TaxID=2980103 RepID=A0ABT5VE85_9BACI|nr:hypothetical protein [Alkalihalobacterium chitinilyticum]MDE5413763.1 hypothetical protein [Alkalihalobacterium chitinilyticum]